MGRCVPSGFARYFAVVLVGLVLGLAGCGNNGPGTAQLAIPASVTITPADNVSLDLGTIQSFTASLRDFQNRILNGETITWVSSNTNVVTVSNSGLVCAGQWNSVTSPQICTPGPAGVAQITALVQGVTSPPTTVYVHGHVDNITVSAVPTVPPTTAPCISKGLSANYQATAFSHGVDVTADVGPFTWAAFNPTVATLNSTVTGLKLNEVQVTGLNPGEAQIYASAAGANSFPLPVQTCLVRSISLKVASNGGTSFSVNQGSAASITPTVIDSQGNQITNVPLTWSSSRPDVVSVSATTGAISTPQPGGAAITASCTPPSCNTGVSPIQPVYSDNVITGTVTRTGTTTPSGTVWTTSTSCGTTTGCRASLFSIDFPANTPGVQIPLPSVPNSIVFNPSGTSAFLGTDRSFSNTTGLMVLNAVGSPPTVTLFTSVSGKVLAISPSGTELIVANTVDVPNEVFIVDVSNTANGVNSTPLLISGATAAAFSPDGLKAFILAGNTLYVRSTVEPLQTIPLTSTPSDVSFLPEGGFAYIAGETPSSVTVRRTCDNNIATDSSLVPQIVATVATPKFLQALPDDTRVVGVQSPGVDLIPVGSIMGATMLNELPCTAATATVPGVPNISTGPASFFDLGQGSFNPTQLLISSDSSRAYVLTDSLPSVLVFNLNNQTPSAIGLAGSAVPLSASLTPDGTMMFVGASDGLVHVLDTSAGIDTAQVAFPSTTSLCIDSTGGPFPGVTCNPDLVAVRP